MAAGNGVTGVAVEVDATGIVSYDQSCQTYHDAYACTPTYRFAKYYGKVESR